MSYQHLSLVERYYIETELKMEASKVTIEMLKPYMSNLHTITADNGKEFADHEEISRELKADFYFAHPYSSYERGLNENTNGLIRQYFPKGSDF